MLFLLIMYRNGLGQNLIKLIEAISDVKLNICLALSL